MTFELDGELFKVLEYSHHKPGRGKATIRTKVRNLRSGTALEKTFNSGDRVQDKRYQIYLELIAERELLAAGSDLSASSGQ